MLIPKVLKRIKPWVMDVQAVTHSVQLRSSVAKITFLYKAESSSIAGLIFHRVNKDYFIDTKGVSELYYDIKNFFYAFDEKELRAWLKEYKPRKHSLRGRRLGHKVRDLAVHSTLKKVLSLPYDIYDFLQNDKYGKATCTIPSYIPVSSISFFDRSTRPFLSILALIYLQENHPPVPLDIKDEKSIIVIENSVHSAPQRKGIVLST
ncbi:MAG: hypothetical protein J7L88_03890 [Thermoplasmata archaeon]|nr:hypothetical protein [Thermoplasmata archaeon]